MNTKLKGDIGQLVVAKELMKRGWNIAFPYGENMKYDLIAEKEGVFKRIQVKAIMPRNGVLCVNCRSSNNWSVIHYKPSDFEVLAAVDLKNEKVYYISSERMRRNLIKLRLKPAKNSQKKGIHFAEEFNEFPV